MNSKTCVVKAVNAWEGDSAIYIALMDEDSSWHVFKVPLEQAHDLEGMLYLLGPKNGCIG